MRLTAFALPSNTNATRSARLALAVLVAGCLTGCGLGTSSTVNAVSSPQTFSVQGKVFGGQQPIVGSTIQLYTVSTTLNGNGTPKASTALLNPVTQTPVLSLAGGLFSITGLYSCSSATQVYITATGGDAGQGSNSAITLMAALGPCNSTNLNASTFIEINELSTVSAAYALSPFTTDYLHIGAAGSNPVGLVNAFNAARLLVNTATGVVNTAPQGMTLPTARLNTLADMLAACVNTGSNSSSTCNTLLTATGATNTFGAALAIAKSPGSATFTSLYSLGSAEAPFVPFLNTQPPDFTVAVNYTGSELASPYGIAFDAGGNAWVTNEAGRSVVKAPTLSTTFATTTFSNVGLLAPRGVSIDPSGNVWIANTGANNVMKLSNSGATLSGGGYSGGGINVPVSVANDASGNAWVANSGGNSITELGTSGTASGTSPITGAGALSIPTSIAIDSSGRVLVGNDGNGELCIFSNAAALQSCVSDGLLFGATAVAVSPSGSVSMAGSTTGSLLSGAFTLATSTGTVGSSSPALGGGLVLPVAVAYGGDGNAWFANSTSISEFSGSTAISPATGLGSLNAPAGLAIDASGNVWTANAGDNSLSVFIGLASPVVTPLAANAGPAQ